MRSLDVFILLEVFTIRKINSYETRIIKDFRDIIICGLRNSSSYFEFIKTLQPLALMADKKLSQLLFQFIKYLSFVYKIYECKF